MKKILIFVICFLVLFVENVNANIICNDGTVSDSCMDCHRGCCSRHDGCTPGGPTTEDNTTTKKVTTTTTQTTVRTTVRPTTITTVSETATELVTTEATTITTTASTNTTENNRESGSDSSGKDSVSSIIGGLAYLTLAGGGGYTAYRIANKKKR